MTRRGGVTLIELVVALAVGSVALASGFLAVQRLVDHRTGAVPRAARRAERAILMAQVFEHLLRDVRSATAPPEGVAGTYVLERWYLSPQGVIERQQISWRVEGTRVVREVAGEAPTIYDFEGLLDEAGPLLDLRLEPVEELLFEPDAAF